MEGRLNRATALAGIVVALLVGVAVGAVAPVEPGEESTPPLTDSPFWIGGTLDSVDGRSVTVGTGEGPVVLETEHAVFFRPTGENNWTSVENPQVLETGVQVCVAAHIHESGEMHAVKAFYNGSCTAVAG